MKLWKLLSIYLTGYFAIFAASPVLAYESLISAGDFDGIQADVITAVGGIMSVIIIVVGAGLLIRALTR